MDEPLCGAVHPGNADLTCCTPVGVGHISHNAQSGEHWPNPEGIQRYREITAPKPRRANKKPAAAAAAAASGERQKKIAEQRKRFTKDSGMKAAYDNGGTPKDNFETLLYFIAQSTPPGVVISSDTVWKIWRELEWPDPAVKQWVGNVMPTAARNGWIEPVTKVANRAGNSHASVVPNTGYYSKVYDPERATLPVYEGAPS
jgi:hypothetical protein